MILDILSRTIIYLIYSNNNNKCLVSWQYNFIFSLMLTFSSFLFASLWIMWLYLVKGHMSSHMTRVHDLSCDHGLFLLCTWVTLTLYLCFIYSYTMTHSPYLWLPWEFTHHWLILPHHILQYDVTTYINMPSMWLVRYTSNFASFWLIVDCLALALTAKELSRGVLTMMLTSPIWAPQERIPCTYGSQSCVCSSDTPCYD